MISQANNIYLQRQKGGAEKLREKSQKAMNEQGAKCRKLTDMFSASTSTNVSGHVSVPDTENVLSSNAEIVDTTTTETPSDPSNEISMNETSNFDESEELIEEPNSTVNSEVPMQVEVCVEVQNFNYFASPAMNAIQSFIAYHPQQQTEDQFLKKCFQRQNGTNRKWLTYSIENNLMYCFICLAFSKDKTSSFINGTMDRRHIHQRIEEHEKSKLHSQSTSAYMQFASNQSIEECVGNHVTKRKEKVLRRRQILERIVDVVKLIGKRGLSYRGSKHEAAYTLSNENVDHGNFLELILLVSKYDVLLKEHVDHCIQQSTSSQGRGSLVTFLSKNTVSKVVSSISNMIQQIIVTEVKSAGKYSFRELL